MSQEGHGGNVEALNDPARDNQMPDPFAAEEKLPAAPVAVIEMTDLLVRAKQLTWNFDTILASMKETLTNPREQPPRLHPIQTLFNQLPSIEDEFNQLVQKMDQLADFARTTIQKFPRAIIIQDDDIPQMTARFRRDISAYDNGIEEVKIRFEISKIRMKIMETKIRKGGYV